jgi:hypothetical protein
VRKLACAGQKARRGGNNHNKEHHMTQALQGIRKDINDHLASGTMLSLDECKGKINSLLLILADMGRVDFQALMYADEQLLECIQQSKSEIPTRTWQDTLPPFPSFGSNDNNAPFVGHPGPCAVSKLLKLQEDVHFYLLALLNYVERQHEDRIILTKYILTKVDAFKTQGRKR